MDGAVFAFTESVGMFSLVKGVGIKLMEKSYYSQQNVVPRRETIIHRQRPIVKIGLEKRRVKTMKRAR